MPAPPAGRRAGPPGVVGQRTHRATRRRPCRPRSRVAPRTPCGGTDIDTTPGTPGRRSRTLGTVYVDLVAVTRSGVIIAEVLTEATLDDATTGIDLIAAVDGDMASVTADAAYDSVAFYDAAGARGAQVVVPPTNTARVSRRRPRSSARDRTIRRVKDIGRRQWKKASGYQRQALVENAFFRYKSIIGTGLRARTPGGQRAEALLACNILNRMTDLGGPESYDIGR